MNWASISVQRYSRQAWLLAIGVSLILVSVRLESIAAFSVGLLTVVFAMSVWWVEGRVRRIAAIRPAPVDPGGARRKLWSRTAVFLLWLCNALLFVFLLPVYVEPSLHRIYSEEMGIDMGDALLAAFGCNFAITLVILLAPRMLDGSAARRRLFVRALCVGTPLALAALALAAYSYISRFSAALRSFGPDLPSPSLALFASQPYWWILPLLALALGIHAWRRSEAGSSGNWAIAGLLVLLLKSGALVSAAVAAVYLVVYPFSCGTAV
jgi:hypothetical protein